MFRFDELACVPASPVSTADWLAMAVALVVYLPTALTAGLGGAGA